MNQALYRKYRPKNFDEIFGQNVIKNTIINEIKTQRISHAYLFYGPRGTGKTSIAKLIAKLVNCENIKNGEACDKCNSCISFNSKNYIDIIEIDAASNNGVDEIREIRNKVNLLPTSSKYKVYIIDEVHMLSIGAFNALLKTLEEPPEHVIFILATTELNKIPSTIVSRCQRFDFKKISSDSIAERLKYIANSENIDITAEAITAISKLTDGGMRDAIGLLDKVYSYTDSEINEELVHLVNYSITTVDLENLILLLYNNDVNSYINLIDSLYSEGKDLIKLVDEMILFLRDILLDNYTKNEMIKELPKETILKYINEFNDLYIQLKNTNYPKILLEIFIIKINNDIKIDIKKKERNIKKGNEKKEAKSISLSNKIDNLEELKKIRINNALATGNKQELLNIKNMYDKFREYTVDNIFSLAASMLLDSNAVICSKKNLIVTFPYESMSNRANLEILAIEKLLNKATNENYKFIALCDNEWNKIKSEYINNLKKGVKFNYIEENADYNKIFNTENYKFIEETTKIFGEDLIEII